jgi:hypothetical protein
LNDINILQKFIHTKSGYNSMICVKWSPTYCSVEKLVNKLSSHDNSHTVEARTVTYEGLEMYCKRDSISNSSVIYKHANKVMWQIHNHVKRISNVGITNGQFYFKIDVNDNMNLVFAKSIKTDKKISVLDQ